MGEGIALALHSASVGGQVTVVNRTRGTRPGLAQRIAGTALGFDLVRGEAVGRRRGDDHDRCGHPLVTARRGRRQLRRADRPLCSSTSPCRVTSLPEVHELRRRVVLDIDDLDPLGRRGRRCGTPRSHESSHRQRGSRSVPGRVDVVAGGPSSRVARAAAERSCRLPNSSLTRPPRPTRRRRRVTWSNGHSRADREAPPRTVGSSPPAGRDASG